MAEVMKWADGVNKRVLRDGTSWQNNTQFIEDETRSGKRKRRMYATQTKRTFSVKMRLTEKEYHLFDDWFVNTLKHGFYAFAFPVIDNSNRDFMAGKIYRFTNDGAPQYSNISGKLIDVSMKWEEMQ